MISCLLTISYHKTKNFQVEHTKYLLNTFLENSHEPKVNKYILSRRALNGNGMAWERIR